MREYAQIILAAVLCGAVLTIINEIRGRLLSPVKGRENVEVFALIVARGEAEGLEETVKGLGWLCDTGRAVMPVIIALEEPSFGAERRAERLVRRTGGAVTDTENLHTAIKEIIWKNEEPDKS